MYIEGLSVNLQCRKIVILSLYSHLLDEHRVLINGKTFKKYFGDISFTYKKNVPLNPFNSEIIECIICSPFPYN